MRVYFFVLQVECDHTQLMWLEEKLSSYSSFLTSFKVSITNCTKMSLFKATKAYLLYQSIIIARYKVLAMMFIDAYT